MFEIVLTYEVVKNWLSDSVHLTHATLHVLVGIFLTIALGRLLRLPLGDLRPLLIVFGLELINEAFDFTRYYVAGYPWTPWPMLADIALTVLPPLAIALAARIDSPAFYRFRRRAHHRIDVPTRGNIR